MSVRDIQAVIKKLQAKKKVLCQALDEKLIQSNKELEEAIPRQRVKCPKCKKTQQLSDTEVIEEFYHEYESGCPNGNTRAWPRGAHYVCESCKWPNKGHKRFKELFEKHRKVFKTITADNHYGPM